MLCSFYLLLLLLSFLPAQHLNLFPIGVVVELELLEQPDLFPLPRKARLGYFIEVWPIRVSGLDLDLDSGLRKARKGGW